MSGSFVRRHLHVLFAAYFIGCCALAGGYLWYVKATSSAFLDAELAACVDRCKPLRAKLETTRQELAYQQPYRQASAYKQAVCKCLG
jgi:hypothetical protein